MANYTRRAANDVSQFLREGGLNSVHADESQDDYPLPDADLDLFMNREFIDFDTGLSTNFKADSPTAPKPGEPVTAATTVPDFGGMDFMSTGRFFLYYCLKDSVILSFYPCVWPMLHLPSWGISLVFCIADKGRHGNSRSCQNSAGYGRRDKCLQL